MLRLAKPLIATLPLVTLSLAAIAQEAPITPLSYGDRPFYLIEKLEAGPLKDKLQSCTGQSPQRTLFSIGHRGAPLQFPEHTVESNVAAVRQGAGILECDVTFTADKELVCRHAQNDLHTTTDILVTPLAEKCTKPFTPAAGETKAGAECRTSDLTLAEFRTLTPKMDSSDPTAATPEAFQGGVPAFRTTAFAEWPHLMTHKESIELFRSMGARFTPELKAASVTMPFDGFTQENYAQKLVDEYKAAGVPASEVHAQSFNLDDVLYWVKNEPEFGANAVYLDDSDDTVPGFSHMDAETWDHSMQELKDMGVQTLAPPIWMLLTLDDTGKMVPSEYATQAKAAGLKLIAWSLERSGPLATGGGYYFSSVKAAINTDADYYNVLHVLAQDVGISGMFSDWPATVTYYANCYGL